MAAILELDEHLTRNFKVTVELLLKLLLLMFCVNMLSHSLQPGIYTTITSGCLLLCCHLVRLAMQTTNSNRQFQQASLALSNPVLRHVLGTRRVLL